MAGKAPRGELGSRKIAAAKAKIAKETLFLKSLRAQCIDQGIAELLGGRETEEGSGIFAIPNPTKAATEALKLARERGEAPPFCFLDKKGVVVPLIKIEESRKIIRQCQQTVHKFGGEL